MNRARWKAFAIFPARIFLAICLSAWAGVGCRGLYGDLGNTAATGGHVDSGADVSGLDGLVEAPPDADSSLGPTPQQDLQDGGIRDGVSGVDDERAGLDGKTVEAADSEPGESADAGYDSDAENPPSPGLSGAVRLMVNGMPVCGGTLIANSWVLTADQCVPSSMAPREIEVGFGADIRAFEQVRRVVEIQRFPGNDGTAPARGRDLLLLGVDAPFRINGATSGYFHPPSPVGIAQISTPQRCLGWDLEPDPSSPTMQLRSEMLPIYQLQLGAVSLNRQLGDRIVWRNSDPRDKAHGVLPTSSDLGMGCLYTINDTEFLTAVQGGQPLLRSDGTLNDSDEALATSTGEKPVRDWLDQVMFGVDVLPTTIVGPIGGCSVRSGSFEVFGLRNDGAMGWLRWANDEEPSWFEAASLEAPRQVALDRNSGPGVVCWPDGSLELLARGVDGTIWWQRLSSDGAWAPGWEPVEDASTAITSGVAAVGVVRDHFHVFARGVGGELRHAEFNQRWLHKWEDLGGSLLGTPSAAMKEQDGRIDVFVRWDDESLRQIWFFLDQWQPWADFGEIFSSGAAVTAWRSQRFDIFGANSGGTLRHFWYDYGWGDTLVDTTIPVPKGDLIALAFGVAHIDLLVRQPDGALWHAFWPRAPILQGLTEPGDSP